MHTIGSSSRHGKNSSTTSNAILHVLSISASVTRLRWRPPSKIPISSAEDVGNVEDLHDAMMAVATAPIKGASAGGAGVLSLWSIHRPYMPLSTVQGHEDGAVADFDWLETPQSPSEPSALSSSAVSSQNAPTEALRRPVTRAKASSFDGEGQPAFLNEGHRRLVGPGSICAIDSTLSRESQDFSDEEEQSFRIWQHVISVGRDGQCIVQSFVRGKPFATPFDPLAPVLVHSSDWCSVQVTDPSREFHHLVSLWQIFLLSKRAMDHCNSSPRSKRFLQIL
jgi:hypothetical protein